MHDRQPAESISELIKSARHRHKLSQRELADALIQASGRDTVTRCDISRWERGKRIPTGHWLHWLSRVLQIPPPHLRYAASMARRHRMLTTAPERPPWYTTPGREPDFESG